MSSPAVARPSAAWWESRWFVAALILLSMVPLLYPPLPPLVDLPGHVGRFRLALGGSPFLDQYYSFRWLPIGNLGVDLIAVPLATLVGIEPAAKLAVMLIPPLTVGGMLWAAKEAHGRLPPTAAFGVPLAYSQPFLFGFVNFALAMALALLVFGLWLRLGRLGRWRLRAAVMIPLSFAVFFAHVFGWAVLGLICLLAETVRQRERGQGWTGAVMRAAPHAAALALPLLLILIWRSDGSGLGIHWIGVRDKAFHLVGIFRDRWMLLDLASIFTLVALAVFARDHRQMVWSRLLLVPGLALVVIFLSLPYMMFGSAYADMRLAPFALLLLVLAIGIASPRDEALARRLAIGAALFAVLRIGATSISLAIAADGQEARLAALDHIPPRSRVIALVERRCEDWAMPRNDHLPSLALARRDSFVNDQWDVPGGTLVTVHYPAAGAFEEDPSQLAAEPGCAKVLTIDQAIAQVPAGAFDMLWLIDAPPRPAPRGWTLRWAGDQSQLYVPAR